MYRDAVERSISASVPASAHFRLAQGQTSSDRRSCPTSGLKSAAQAYWEARVLSSSPLWFLRHAGADSPLMLCKHPPDLKHTMQGRI